MTYATTNKLYDKRLVVVAGKGGVGRTTVAAAFAAAAARRGKRVLLCQTKSKERLSTLFAVPPVGTNIAHLREGLSAVNMTPQAALREYGTMILRSEFVAKQVLENKITRAFLKAVPGLEDYSMLGKVWYHAAGDVEGARPRWDLVVMDGPATGHLLTMLGIPQAILEAVPEGPLSRPARSTQDLLRDPSRSAMLLVTLAEDMPANETVELARRQANEVGMSLGPLVINQLYPERFTGSSPTGSALDALLSGSGQAPLLMPLLDAAEALRHRRQLNERYLAWLHRELPVGQIHLPFLFTRQFGPNALDEISHRLDEQLTTELS
jgi:anion-transporting  ArsA/GET3 family ATPase